MMVWWERGDKLCVVMIRGREGRRYFGGFVLEVEFGIFRY